MPNHEIAKLPTLHGYRKQEYKFTLLSEDLSNKNTNLDVFSSEFLHIVGIQEGVIEQFTYFIG